MICIAGIYVYYLFTLKHKDTADLNPAFTVEALPFIKEFEKFFFSERHVNKYFKFNMINKNFDSEQIKGNHEGN